MLTDHNIGDLLQAGLAINVGYLALERFRYRDEIDRMLRNAEASLNGMPEGYREDKAWKDMNDLRRDRGPGRSNHAFLSVLNRSLFTCGWDRFTAVTGAAV